MKKLLFIGALLCCMFMLTGSKGGSMTGTEADFQNSFDGYEDLSRSESANCYIVSDAGSYMFKAVKGNSNESVGNVASVCVLWETYGTMKMPEISDFIKNVSYGDGYIAFQTADTFKEGNAVIAAEDAFGKILWSWHIWFTDKPQGQVYYNGAGTMMDRNLGATSAEPGKVFSLGLWYQWGRKDPFVGPYSISARSAAKSTITWPSSVISDSSTGTIEYAVENPTTFIAANDDNGDWYYTGSSSTDNTRWTTSDKTKSIFDPCPAGWRVPDGGDNSVWAKAKGSPYSLQHPYNSSSYGMNLSGIFGSDETIWYPAAGNRWGDGRVDNVSKSGRYWSASPCDGYHNAYDMVFGTSGNINPSKVNEKRACGLSVRCIKE